MSSPTLASAALARTGDSRARTFATNFALVIGFSAFIALSAQISVRVWDVPFTGQTLAVLLTGAVLGPRMGVLAVLAYLAEGMAGLPVFASGANAWAPTRFPGVPYLLGPTGGYLAGFVLAAGLVGWLAERGWDGRQDGVPSGEPVRGVGAWLAERGWGRFVLRVAGWLTERGWDRSVLRTVLAMLLGEVAIYALALPWLARFLPTGVLEVGLYPFLAGDALKVVIAATALPGAWALLGRRSRRR